MIALLVGIPAMAVTDFRVWSDTPPDDLAGDLQPPTVSTIVSPPTITRLPEVDISQEPWFASAHQQLRACGASYVRLERWNTEQPIFHFRCDLQTGSGPESFEALSGSPRAAIGQVVRQATAWRAANTTRPPGSNSRPTSRPRIAEPEPLNGTSWR